MKSKLEMEKLEVIAMLTNLKLANVRLTKENMDLKEMLMNNQDTQDVVPVPEIIVSSKKWLLVHVIKFLFQINEKSNLK